MRVFYKSVIAVLIHCICFTSIVSIRLPGKGTTIKNTVVNYFQCWNQRDMTSAIACFSPDCEYEDTLYPKVFKGKEELQQHLFNVAASLPKSFQFVIDDISEDTRNGKLLLFMLLYHNLN